MPIKVQRPPEMLRKIVQHVLRLQEAQLLQREAHHRLQEALQHQRGLQLHNQKVLLHRLEMLHRQPERVLLQRARVAQQDDKLKNKIQMPKRNFRHFFCKKIL